MRQLDRFEQEQDAQIFSDVLCAAGIDNSVKPSREGGVDVWVHDDRRMNEARAILADHQADPEAARFAGAAQTARERRRAKDDQVKKVAKRSVQVRDRLARPSRIGPVTLALIVISVGVALVTTSPSGIAALKLGDKTDMVAWLSFQSYIKDGDFFRWYRGLTDLTSGQVWRVVTPIFIHFGVLHIVFNMWWLRDLGTFIERRQSSWLLAAMVLVIAMVSNSAQYLIIGTPTFGGMSGVVYGLFAYIWIRGRFDPSSGFAINRQMVYWMIGFYVLCWTGFVGPVANVAHTGGLVVGAIWGGLAAGVHRRLLGKG